MRPPRPRGPVRSEQDHRPDLTPTELGQNPTFTGVVVTVPLRVTPDGTLGAPCEQSSRDWNSTLTGYGNRVLTLDVLLGEYDAGRATPRGDPRSLSRSPRSLLSRGDLPWGRGGVGGRDVATGLDPDASEDKRRPDYFRHTFGWREEEGSREEKNPPKVRLNDKRD